MEVVPAWAGVILVVPLHKVFPCGSPRVGGGDPQKEIAKKLNLS